MFSDPFASNQNQNLFNQNQGFFGVQQPQFGSSAHRASVSLIPLLSLLVTQSNELLRFVPSNELLRTEHRNELRYTNLNESFRKTPLPGLVNKPMTLSLMDDKMNGFVGFKTSGYKQVTELLTFFPVEPFDADILNDRSVGPSPPLSTAPAPSSSMPFYRKLSAASLENPTIPLLQTTLGPADLDADLASRFSQYLLNPQFNMGQPQPPQQPLLRLVGSFSDLKNGMINESIIDQRSDLDTKLHYYKSRSMNLNQYYPEDLRYNHRAANSLNSGSFYQEKPQYQRQYRRKSDPKREEKKSSEKELFNKYKNVPFEQLESKILKFAVDQNGCRFLQKKLEDSTIDRHTVIEIIYRQIQPEIYSLVMDLFGNYLIQKIFEYLLEEQRTCLIKRCAPRFDEILLNQHGTRALQKMIENVTTQEQVELIVNNLADHVVRLIKDLNGNHVIQKCLFKFSPEYCQFIIDGICLSVDEVATHRHGCCVLQKCLDRLNHEQFVKLGHEILKNGLSLMQDPFGNYVIQFLLPRKTDMKPNFAEIIGHQIVGRLEGLSTQKFASNVVEKCLKYINNDTHLRDTLVEEVLNFNSLELVLKDPYGNYVVQTALEVATGDLRDRVIETVGSLMPYVKNTPYARKIQQKIAEAESAKRR